MMTKRTHGGPKAVLALIASVSLLAGCSSANQTGTTGSTNTPGTKETPTSSTAKASGTVTFWYDKTGVAGEAIKAAADAFQAAHPEIKLNAVYVADLTVGGGQKLMSAVAGGTAPGCGILRSLPNRLMGPAGGFDRYFGPDQERRHRFEEILSSCLE